LEARTPAAYPEPWPTAELSRCSPATTLQLTHPQKPRQSDPAEKQGVKGRDCSRKTGSGCHKQMRAHCTARSPALLLDNDGGHILQMRSAAVRIASKGRKIKGARRRVGSRRGTDRPGRRAVPLGLHVVGKQISLLPSRETKGQILEVESQISFFMGIRKLPFAVG